MRVRPKNASVARLIKHPQGGGFVIPNDDPSNPNFDVSGVVTDWPDDAFTTRRLRDGDVIAIEGAGAQQQQAQPASGGQNPQPQQQPEPQAQPQPEIASGSAAGAGRAAAAAARGASTTPT